jgi:hypothetical protein
MLYLAAIATILPKSAGLGELLLGLIRRNGAVRETEGIYQGIPEGLVDVDVPGSVTGK